MSKKRKKGSRLHSQPKLDQPAPTLAAHPFSAVFPRAALEKAREYPLYGCWVMDGWQDMGLTPVVVARKQDAERVMFAVYLVDTYCLGVKDAFTRTDYTLAQFNRDLIQICVQAPRPCSVELAHELIYGSIEYAKALGFDPHPDYYRKKADRMLDPPDAHPRNNQVSFGVNGKPLYVSGPYESKGKIKSIRHALDHGSETENPPKESIFGKLKKLLSHQVKRRQS